jgi:hypothetical protein
MVDSVPPEEIGIAELVQRAAADSATLVRLEVALARDELREARGNLPPTSPLAASRWM